MAGILKIFFSRFSRTQIVNEAADLALQRLLDAVERAEHIFEKHKTLTSPGD